MRFSLGHVKAILSPFLPLVEFPEKNNLYFRRNMKTLMGESHFFGTHASGMYGNSILKFHADLVLKKIARKSIGFFFGHRWPFLRPFLPLLEFPEEKTSVPEKKWKPWWTKAIFGTHDSDMYGNNILTFHVYRTIITEISTLKNFPENPSGKCQHMAAF